MIDFEFVLSVREVHFLNLCLYGLVLLCFVINFEEIGLIIRFSALSPFFIKVTV